MSPSARADAPSCKGSKRWQRSGRKRCLGKTATTPDFAGAGSAGQSRARRLPRQAPGGCPRSPAAKPGTTSAGPPFGANPAPPHTAAPRRFRQAQPHFPPPGPPDSLGAAAHRTHPSRRVRRQLPGAHHGAVTLHYQPRFPRPETDLTRIAIDSLPALPVHQCGGSFRPLHHYFPDAATVRLHSVVFLELPAGLLEGLFRAKAGQGPLQSQRLALTLQTGQLLERPLAAVVLGATQIRGLASIRPRALSRHRGLPPVQVARAAHPEPAEGPRTGDKGGLSFGLLSFHLSPGLHHPPAQLPGKPDNLFFTSVRVPLAGPVFPGLLFCNRR